MNDDIIPEIVYSVNVTRCQYHRSPKGWVVVVVTNFRVYVFPYIEQKKMESVVDKETCHFSTRAEAETEANQHRARMS